jgi:hypothetical protein
MKKTVKNSKDNYDFSIFDNYKCEGQLEFKINGQNIEIGEEESNKSNTRIEQYNL